MYCNTSVISQIARGVLAVACIVGAIMLSHYFWATIALVAAAVILMRGCPACWLTGLLEAMESGSNRKQPQQARHTHHAP